MKYVMVIGMCFFMWWLSGCFMQPHTAYPPITMPPPGSSPGQVLTATLNLPWIVTAGALGVTAGIVGLIFGPPAIKNLAAIAAVGCAIFLGLMLLIAAYAKWFAFGALGLVVVCVVWALVNKTWVQTEIKEHILGGKKV